MMPRNPVVMAVIAMLALAHAAAAAPPNIVYIVADDLGYADMGFMGSDIRTPALDELAATGAQLMDFHVQPMCTPSRAALMTGRYPFRYGLQTGVIPGPGLYGIPLDETLLPQVLQDAGYETAMVGKWHLGHASPDLWPMQRGFDSFYGALVGEIDHFTLSSHGARDWYRGNEPSDDQGFDNLLFADEAVRVIAAHDTARPLFLYLAFTAPHTPFQAPDDWLAQYAGRGDANAQAYAAMVSIVDDGVARVVAALDEKGMRDNTLIMFHSDNGGVTSSLFAGDTKVDGGLPASNAPLRDGKGTLYEGGTRVAAIANWPGHVKAEKVEGMIHIVDMLPTIAHLAGAAPQTKPLDGRDLWPVISEGAPSPREDIVYNVDPLAGAVRDGDWKLVWKAALPPKLELFDLSADPSETTDLSAAHPDRVAQMQARIAELAASMAPPLLIMEAIRLTFYAPPATPDAAALFSIGD